MQKLIIKNFGPIKNVELEIKDFMVFIGDNAVGKTTISRIINFFFSLPYHVTSTIHQYTSQPLTKDLIDLDLWNLFNQNINKTFLQNFNEFLKDDESIGIDHKINNEMFIRFGSFDDELKFVFSSSLENLLKSYFEKIKETITFDAFDSIQKRQEFIINLSGSIQNTVNNDFMVLYKRPKYQMWSPAGRSILSKYPEINFSNVQNFDPLFSDFQYTTNTIRSLFTEKSIYSFKIKESEIVNKLVKRILKGDYKHIDGEDRLYFDEKNYISFANASSGQQEALWTIKAIETFLNEGFEENTIHLEEPETHLFPNSQKDLIDLLSIFINHKHELPLDMGKSKNPINNCAVITTHSPYILTALNNNLYAHRVGLQKPEETNKVIPKELWINPKRFSCHYVDNGGIESIFNIDDSGMIDVDRIDEISDVINEKFEDLMSIE